MTVPLILIETLERYLPDIKDFEEDFIDMDLSYENRDYAVRFYKVNDDKGISWLCNPSRIREKIKQKQVENHELLSQ